MKFSAIFTLFFLFSTIGHLYSEEIDLQRGECRGCPEDHPVGECDCDGWRLYVHYEPYRYDKRCCIEELVPYKKECCEYVLKQYEVEHWRYVPECYIARICFNGCEYDVERYRYVPESYTETIMRKEPVYWCVYRWKTRKRWVTHPSCEYIPYYYWKCQS